MTTKAIDKPAKSDRSAVARPAANNKTASTRDPAVNATVPGKREATQVQPPADARATKQALLLQLLNRPDGASIDDMMQATAWQQHSVRGFMAGTVKKKLGLSLTSSKAEGEVRRYRITARRGR